MTWFTVAWSLIVITFGACKANTGHETDRRWSEEPLAPVTVKIPDPDSIAGARTVSITIDLPHGFNTRENYRGVEWSANLGYDFTEPFIQVTSGLTHTQPDNLSPTPKSQIVRTDVHGSDELVIISGHGDSVIRAESWKRLNDELSVSCLAVQARDTMVQNADETLGWLERICRSLKVNSK